MTTDSSDSTFRSILLVIASVLGILLLFPLLMMLFGVSMGMTGGFGPGGMVGPSEMTPVWGVGMLLLFLLVVGGLGYVLYRSLS